VSGSGPGAGTGGGEGPPAIVAPVSALVLVGLPGVGKSTVGAGIAGRLGWDFLDLDVEIERREGRSVARLFAEEGEGYFRERERALTAELAGRRRLVVAPGGGWAAQPGLMALLRPPATIIYLAASPEAVARRLGDGGASRPLLAGGDAAGTRNRLARLLADRAAAYQAADLVIDTELIDVQGVIDMLQVVARAQRGR